MPAGWPGLPARLGDVGAAASQGFPPVQPWPVESCNLPSSAVGGAALNLSFVLAAGGEAVIAELPPRLGEEVLILLPLVQLLPAFHRKNVPRRPLALFYRGHTHLHTTHT